MENLQPKKEAESVSLTIVAKVTVAKCSLLTASSFPGRLAPPSSKAGSYSDKSPAILGFQFQAIQMGEAMGSFRIVTCHIDETRYTHIVSHDITWLPESKSGRVACWVIEGSTRITSHTGAIPAAILFSTADPCWIKSPVLTCHSSTIIHTNELQQLASPFLDKL